MQTRPALAITFSLSFFCAANTAAEPVAFPGAEGFGSATRGAYQLYASTEDSDDLPAVYHVESLADSGAGSFREAASAQGPRIIVFDTGGIVTLRSDVVIRNPYLTIAGQTAPGDGICFRGASIRMRSTATTTVHDIIVRGIRVRPTAIDSIGDASQVWNRDSVSIEAHHQDPFPNEPYNIVVDHCSFSWSTDEIVSVFYGGYDITFSNNMMHQPSTLPRNSGEGHHYGPLFGLNTSRITLLRNLITHAVFRTPLIGGTLDGAVTGQPQAGTDIETINNLVYNTRNWFSSTGAGTSGNGVGPTKLAWIGNYYKQGNDASGAPDRFYVGVQSQHSFDEGSAVYMHDNLTPRRTAGSQDDWEACGPQAACERSLRVDEMPFSGSGVAPVPSSEIPQNLTKVTDGVPAIGAYPRDAVDEAAVADALSGTDFLGDSGHYGPGPTSPEIAASGQWTPTSELFPYYDPGVRPDDTDGDGMPDHWEIERGLDSNDAADAHHDRDGDGYTNIEEHINSFFLSPDDEPELDGGPTDADVPDSGLFDADANEAGISDADETDSSLWDGSQPDSAASDADGLRNDSEADEDSDQNEQSTTERGCSCDVAPGRTGTSLPLAALLAVAIVLLRRKKGAPNYLLLAPSGPARCHSARARSAGVHDARDAQSDADLDAPTRRP